MARGFGGGYFVFEPGKNADKWAYSAGTPFLLMGDFFVVMACNQECNYLEKATALAKYEQV